MDRLDRRVQRSQELLGDALVALIMERGYERITIKDVTERANVAYVTFFRHYRDLDELLAQRVEAAIADLIAAMESAAPNAWDHNDPQHNYADGLLIFQHAQANAAFYRILNSSQGAFKVRRRVTDQIAQLLITRCEDLFLTQGSVPPEIAANHIAASLLALIDWWLENDMPYPAGEMAAIYERLIVAPVFQPLAAG